MYKSIDFFFENFMRTTPAPGLVYGVVHQGRLAHSAVAGVANLQSRVPVSIETRFRLASLTKVFTATAMLQLRDAGKVDFNCLLCDYLPHFATIPDASSAKKIRIIDLLAHTAGFVTDDPWADRQLDLSDEAFQHLVANGVPLAQVPGHKFEYSNYGYALLGAVISKVSGMRFQEYVTQKILQPLHMMASVWATSADSNHSQGYRREGREWIAEPVLQDGAFAAMGGLWTTASDYALYVDFLLSAWSGKPDAHEEVLSQSSRRELARAQTNPFFVPSEPADKSLGAMAVAYGLGMYVVADARYRIAMAHPGGLPGYGAHVFLAPELNCAVFAFANCTYAPLGKPVRQAISFFHDELAANAIVAPKEWDEIRKAVRQMYLSATVAASPFLLASNLLLDRGREQRDGELRVIREKLGAMQGEETSELHDGMSGKCSFRCEHGVLEVFVVLAPTREIAIQSLTFSAQESS